jgi:hypothetical protein
MSAGFFIVLSRFLNVNFVWILLLVSFSLAITGALILFHFLSATASITHESYKLGGASAGFVVLFTLFYNLANKPIPDNSPLSRIAQSPLGEKLVPIAESYQRISQLNNEAINKIAESSLRKLGSNFDQLAHGTYDVDADELHTYLFPLIDNAKKFYFAAQYILPEKFWTQYWADQYFDENVKAIRERGIKLVRIFIFDELDGSNQRTLLDEVVRKHVEYGIDVRLVDKLEYLKANGSSSEEDLRDILLVDGQISGLLIPRKRGSFKIEFSIDPEKYDKRDKTFDRLLKKSLSYEQWSKKGSAPTDVP